MAPIRVLQVVPNMHAAGLETVIMNMYRNIDRNKVQFDFLVHYKQRYFYDDEIEALGGKIYRLSFREDNNFIKYLKDLKSFFSTHVEYKIIHGHMASTAYFYLRAARKQNIPIRILHSHNTSTEKNSKGKIKRQMLKLSTIYANKYCACSIAAGEFLFGKRKFNVINNAINVEYFAFDPKVREVIRKELNVDDYLVLGNIGRFNTQKNHKFILKVFFELLKINPDARLLLVGEGELESKIKTEIRELGIGDKVMLLGVRKDVNLIYQALDFFLLPSLFEGLPVVGVESQASGTVSIVSSKVTEELKITDLVSFLPLEKGADYWAHYIKNYRNYQKKDVSEQIKNSGYEIKTEANKLMQYYIDLCSVNNNK